MPELDSITIQGLKSIRSVDNLKLGAINVVISPNGSGKSNFLGVFSFLHAIREGRLEDYVTKAGGAEKILHFGSKTTNKIHLKISFEDGENQYEIDLLPTANDQLYSGSERVYFGDKTRFLSPTTGA